MSVVLAKTLCKAGYTIGVAYTTAQLHAAGGDLLFSFGLSLMLVPVMGALAVMKMGEDVVRVVLHKAREGSV